MEKYIDPEHLRTFVATHDEKTWFWITTTLTHNGFSAADEPLPVPHSNYFKCTEVDDKEMLYAFLSDMQHDLSFSMYIQEVGMKFAFYLPNKIAKEIFINDPTKKRKVKYSEVIKYAETAEYAEYTFKIVELALMKSLFLGMNHGYKIITLEPLRGNYDNYRRIKPEDLKDLDLKSYQALKKDGFDVIIRSKNGKAYFKVITDPIFTRHFQKAQKSKSKTPA